MISGFDGTLKDLGPQVISQIEYEIKYEGFIHRQQKEVEKFRHIEYIRIPEGFDFKGIPGLSKEIVEKLNRFNPVTLGAGQPHFRRYPVGHYAFDDLFEKMESAKMRLARSRMISAIMAAHWVTRGAMGGCPWALSVVRSPQI